MSRSRAAIGPEQAAFAAAGHPIFVVDAANNVCLANVAAESFWRMSISGQSPHSLVSLLGQDCGLFRLLAQARREERMVKAFDVAITPSRAEQVFYTDAYVNPLHPGAEEMVVSLHYHPLADTRYEQHQWHDASKAASVVASVLAHELKNPLSGIKGAAQLLELRSRQTNGELAGLICKEVDRITALIDQLDVFSGSEPLPMELINIHEVIDHVYQLASVGFAQGIALAKHYDPSLPAIHANRDQMVQLLVNLVKNAAEATSGVEAPKIELKTAYRSGPRLVGTSHVKALSARLEISVLDNGPGIETQMRRTMFDPFVTSKRTGTGLGLSVVAQIAARHRGMVECDSSESGTIFRVLLPLEVGTNSRDDND